MKHLKKIAFLVFITFFASISFASDTIKIASWNIQNFGESKANNDAKMALIATILSQFDIIAVQEISNVYEKADTGCPRNEKACPGHKNCYLLKNALKKYLAYMEGRNYDFIFSPQVKDERYLFIYDRKKLTAIDDGQLVSDKGDDPDTPICDAHSQGDMVRQPFFATFKAGNFDFTLVTAHTSPKRNLTELKALNNFYSEIQDMDSNQNDVILLGDLNADCSYLSETKKIDLRKPQFIWVIDNAQDTTVGSSNCAYDRIIFTSATKEDYTGKWGVFRFDEVYDLGKEVALKLSDHYPRKICDNVTK
jgi:endonuclease/exonuclease/phosphatase family metal-dependent hydrolase